MAAAKARSDFAQWLELTLSNKGIRNRDLARDIGADEGSVSKWRTGKRTPPPKMISKLAQYLEVDPFRLIVTAGVLDPEDAGVDPLPLPPPDAIRAQLRKQLSANKGLTQDQVEAMLAAYDQKVREHRKQEGSP